MAARRGPHVISLRDSNPPLLGHAPGASPAAAPAPAREEGGLLAHHPRAAAGASTAHPAFAAILERLEARDRDIQELLVDNQRFAATHVALQQQLIAAQHELRAVSVAATRARAEREVEVRALADQAAHIEAEARAVAAARAEADQVHADVQVLAAARNELVNRLQVLREQLVRKQADASKTASVRAQIETMRREIQKGRSAVDFEKKAHSDNLEQSKAMEKNMIAVASEIERLRGELANAEKGATTVNPAAPVANSGYATAYGNPEATYTAMYGNPEATYAAHSYPDAYSTNQAHMHTDGNSHYMSQPVPYGQGQYDSQHTNVQR
ncbi:hypothetical protein HU200_012979 [Digitaria exilis]|uniref:Uncharacterized protein n=1 Tax=Digitaria exilis TaxID=1010633 RepID=A0A835FEZ2_9POAL|nr:hypothetical protein HU200_012979 [Digitaria exilis]CAB3497689.1 unnamed protein product [Digitaria exilis]